MITLSQIWRQNRSLWWDVIVEAKVTNILFPVAQTFQNLFDGSIFSWPEFVICKFDISATNEKKKSFIFVTYQNMSPINVFTEVFLFEFVFNKTNTQYL